MHPFLSSVTSSDSSTPYYGTSGKSIPIIFPSPYRCGYIVMSLVVSFAANICQDTPVPIVTVSAMHVSVDLWGLLSCGYSKAMLGPHTSNLAACQISRDSYLEAPKKKDELLCFVWHEYIMTKSIIHLNFKSISN